MLWPAPTGATELYGVIGDPVRHSLSPVLHNAAFAALGLDAVYVAMPVTRGEGGAAVAAMRTLGISGLSVTMPHKEAAAAACDVLTDDAQRLGVVNTVARLADGRLLGDSTDGEGLCRALAEDGVELDGRRIVLVGAGGSARAVALALGRRGVELTVVARRVDQAASVAALAPGGRALALAPAPVAAPADTAVVATLLSEADVVDNATPVGMSALTSAAVVSGPDGVDGGRQLPVPVDGLRADAVVVDLIYHPAETVWLAAARARGLRTVNGLGMLLHQAALACERWTGHPAPVEAMRSAVLDELARR